MHKMKNKIMKKQNIVKTIESLKNFAIFDKKPCPQWEFQEIFPIAVSQPFFKAIFGRLLLNFFSCMSRFYYTLRKKKMSVIGNNKCSFKYYLPVLSQFFWFYNPYKHEKTPGFVMFSGVIEIQHWLKWVKSRNIKDAAKYCSTRNLGKFSRKRGL